MAMIEGQEHLERLASSLVHATYAPRAPSIVAYGLLTEQALTASGIARAYVHLVPASPTQSWFTYKRTAKDPNNADCYIWIDRTVVDVQNLYMCENHAVLTKSIHPKFIEAIGVWVQGLGGHHEFDVRIIYNKAVGERRPIDFTDHVSSDVLLSQKLAVKQALPVSEEMPAMRCLSCTTAICAFWLQCPHCDAAFIYRGSANFAGASKLITTALPVEARENPRYQRILTFGPKQSGKASKEANAVKEAAKLYKHLKAWEDDADYRRKMRAEGRVMFLNTKPVSPWEGDIADPYELSPQMPVVNEYGAATLIGAYIMRTAHGDAQGKEREREDYEERRATYAMVLLSDKSAGWMLANHAELTLTDQIVAAAPPEKRAEVESRELASGKKAFNPKLMDLAIGNAAALLSLMEIDTIAP